MAEVKISLKNMVTNATLTIGEITTRDYVLSNVDWGQIQSERQTSAHPAQIGESVLSVTLGTRDVLIKGYVVNESGVGLSALKRTLASLVNPMQLLRMTYDSPLSAVGTVYLDFYPSTTVTFGKESRENNDMFCYFEIEGKSYNPLFFSATERTVELSSSQQSVQVLGDVTTGFTFALVASGSVSNPAIRNNYTGELLKFNFALSSGQSLVGSTMPGDRYVSRRYTSGGIAMVENAMRYLDLDSKWLMLSATNQSANVFRTEATSGVGNMQATMTYRPGYLEVQAIE